MDTIDRIRAFSRFYTGRLGLLGRSYLGSGLGMTEVRLLHDLDSPGPHGARGLAQALGLDEGYVSRALAGFERRGWIARVPSQADARRRDVDLTTAGRALAAALKAQSRAAVGQVLAPLPPAVQDEVAAALDRAAALLSAPLAPHDLRDLAPGDVGWVIGRHGAVYARDEGYDATFEALVARLLADWLDRRDPARERGWIAWRGGVRVGSIFCMAEGPQEPDVARLRLFLIEASDRGTGLAQRMIGDCLDFARTAGYRRMRLWTHESHRAAGRLYARQGFALVSARAARAFGQDVVDQTWERDL